MINCAFCGSENKDNSTYCVSCGNKVVSPQSAESSSTFECPHCRQLNPVNNIFCGSCGKNMKLGAENQTSQANASDQKLTGIGGWLIIVIIGLCFTIVSSIYTIFDTMTFETLSFDHDPIVIFEFLFALSVAILAIIALVLLLKKKAILPQFMVYYYTAVIVLNLIDIIWLANYLDLDINYGYLLGSLLAPVIWILYFKQSVRVKNTFVN